MSDASANMKSAKNVENSEFYMSKMQDFNQRARAERRLA
jgi:hypothetical protein